MSSVKIISRGLALVLLLAFAAGTASAQDLAIAAFNGHWQGSGISESEVSENFRLTSRDIDITIAVSGNGFALTATTVQRQKGDPSNPRAVRKSTTREFQSSGRAGLWQAVGGQDPAGAGGYVWARIKERTLSVFSVRVSDDGGSEMLVYDRTLSGSGMKLEFRRLVDGNLLRTVKGRLIKTEN